MSTRLLIMGASLRKVADRRPLPAIRRYNSARWDVLRETLMDADVTSRPRIIVLSPQYLFISASQPIEFYTKEWRGLEWRRDLPQILHSYGTVLRPLIDAGTDIFVSANAPHIAVLHECGFYQHVMERNASVTEPANIKALQNDQLRSWLMKGI